MLVLRLGAGAALVVVWWVRPKRERFTGLVVVVLRVRWPLSLPMRVGFVVVTVVVERGAARLLPKAMVV
jgi:hypothetical protein